MKERSCRSTRGMVLVIVIAAIAMMSIVVMGMLSRNVSRALTAENQVRRLQAEALAKGSFWLAYQNNGVLPSGFSEPLGGAAHDVSYTMSTSDGPGGTDTIKTVVSY